VDFPLLSILALAALVRYWGISFGLPYVAARPDETTVMNVAMTFFSGDFNPHFFRYPTLHMYCLFCLYCGYFLFGLLTGRYLCLRDFAREYVINPTNFFLLDRFFSAFLGVATVYITYRLAREMFGRRIALISSFFLALAYLHARDSHFGVTDVPAAFLVICSMLFILKSRSSRNLRDYLYAGILAGLAASTKYAGVLLLVPIFSAHILNSLEEGKSLGKSLLDKRVLLFIAALAAAFLLTTPFALLDYPKFASHLTYEIHHLSRGHQIILGRGWWYHLRFSLPLGLGWSLFLASLLGFFILLKRDAKKGILLYSFPLAYYLLSGKGYTVFLRYMIPLVPFLCISAAICVVEVSDALRRRLRLHGNVSALLLAVFIILPSANSLLQFNRLIAKKDNRAIAAEWVSGNIPPHASIYLTGPIWRRHQTHPALELLESKFGLTDSLKAASSSDSGLGALGEYDEWTYEEKSGKFLFDGRIMDSLPQYIILRESPLRAYDRIPRGIAEVLNRYYSLRESFRAIDTNDKRNWFDQQDAFYLPFAGFSNVQRPGPNIYIYERKDSPAR